MKLKENNEVEMVAISKSNCVDSDDDDDTSTEEVANVRLRDIRSLSSFDNAVRLKHGEADKRQQTVEKTTKEDFSLSGSDDHFFSTKLFY